MQMTINPLNFLIKETESGFLYKQMSHVFLHGKRLKSPCTLCGAAAYCCGAVALCVTAALLGRFLPRLGPLLHQKRPFFLGPLFSVWRAYACEAKTHSHLSPRTIVREKESRLFCRGLERAEIAERDRGRQHIGEDAEVARHLRKA